MTERYEIVDLGFSVADAEGISFGYNGDHLLLTFEDWMEKSVRVEFKNVLGFRFQEADYYNSNSERDDCCHIVRDSIWLQAHKDQGLLWGDETWRHYKLNFNAGGIIEVLCSDAVKT